MGVLERIHHESRYCHRCLHCSRLCANLLQEGPSRPPWPGVAAGLSEALMPTPVLTRAARTPAREILAVHSCAATSSPELSLGDTGALRLVTQECTHRLPTSLTGSTHTCNHPYTNM